MFITRIRILYRVTDSYSNNSYFPIGINKLVFEAPKARTFSSSIETDRMDNIEKAKQLSAIKAVKKVYQFNVFQHHFKQNN